LRSKDGVEGGWGKQGEEEGEGLGVGGRMGEGGEIAGEEIERGMGLGERRGRVGSMGTISVWQEVARDYLKYR
jgi:hypothetical protein